MITRANMADVKRLVVKVGTSTLTHQNGRLNLFRIEKLVRELADLANQGMEVILVTSGAVGVGMNKMGLKERPKTIPVKQALAAVGQGILMHTYDKLFTEYGQTVGQVLLTKEDSVKRKLYMNSRNTLLTLLGMGIIPIINENDAVAIDELKIGDNDTLSATVAAIVDADLLILLSDIEGVYTANPHADPAAVLLSEIAEITPEVEALAGGAGSVFGVGGMHTKIQAAKVAVNAGVTMVIAAGGRDGVIREILAGAPAGTIFPAKQTHLQVRKSWLAFGARLKGAVTVDAGCEEAIVKNGSSLLAVGITGVEGDFESGGAVQVFAGSGREIARGLINYNSGEVKKIMGLHTGRFQEILNGKVYDEVIHRDNMVLMV